MILKGAIGSGKTHALKAIQNRYQQLGWNTKFVEHQCIEAEISTEKPTILLCDNFFGRFGNCVFSQTELEQTEKILKLIESSEEKIKIVTGIHAHVYDELRSNLKPNCLKQKNILVEMDDLSEMETMAIFKEQLKKRDCSNVSNCSAQNPEFKSVLDKFSNKRYPIGRPFLSLMFCLHRDLFSNENFYIDPIKALMQHFQKMREDSGSLYSCLVHLTCVVEQKRGEKPKGLQNSTSADTFEKIVSQSCLVTFDDNKISFVHDILTILLFKSAAETKNMFSFAAENCEIDIMLQLFRPAQSNPKEPYLEFPDPKINDVFRPIGKILIYRLTNTNQAWDVHHPLNDFDFFKEKYHNYLKFEPNYK